MRGKVLVLGADTRSFLTVVRSLGRAGLEVHAGWCPPGSPELRSRYISRVLDLPPYRRGEDAWREALAARMDREGYDLVIPTNDLSLLPLQKHRDALEPHGRLYLLDGEAFRIANDKHAAGELARKLGIPLPEEMPVGSVEEAERALEAFGLPLVLKPVSSFTLDRLDRKRHVVKVFRAEELPGAVRGLLAGGPVVAQKHVNGVGYGIEILADKGGILAAFQHRRVHEPLHGGGSSYRVSEPLDPEFLEATSRLLEAVGYSGVAMVEYKRDRRSGEWIFVEINGRFWGSLPLAVAAGVDFPFYLYQYLVEGRRDFPRGYRVGLYGRNLLMDLRWSWQNLKADRGDPALQTVPLGRVALEWFNPLLGREVSDTFVRDDPAPGFAELRELGRFIAEGVRVVGGRLLLRSPLRRLLEERARKKLLRARNILFVCKGNIIRSPFAEAWLRASGTPVSVRSSGYYPVANRPSPPEAVRAAAELKVDLGAHRSRLLVPEDVARADVVAVFDRENARVVLERFPWARRKLVRLGLLAGRADGEIADPFGGSPEDYRESYRLIRRSLEVLTSRW